MQLFITIFFDKTLNFNKFEKLEKHFKEIDKTQDESVQFHCQKE